MIEDKVAYIICMYKEYNSVTTTINTIRNNYKNAYIVIVQSKNDSIDDKFNHIYNLADEIIILPNLAKEYNLLPDGLVFQNSDTFYGHIICHAGCRNASVGFSAIQNKKFKYIVGLTGDTKITNTKSINDAANTMIANNLVLGCAKAYGQLFFSNESPSAYNVIASRYQDSMTTDFVNTLYIINGDFFNETKCLTNIKITNTMTTEQCFGDAFLNFMTKEELLKKTFLLNSTTPQYCYGFNDGIEYHQSN